MNEFETMGTTEEIQSGGNRRRLKMRILAAALCVCLLVLTAGGTLAYFNAQEKARNVITTGKLAMTLHDETTGGKPFPESGINGVMPAMDVDKLVYVENTGNADLYARIALDREITAAAGVEAKLDFEHITLNIDTKNWTEKDGYYYYNRALKPGEKSEPLFTTVSFGAELGNEYMDAHVQIDVNAQAVQSKNNTGSALTAAGWPEK